MEYSNERCARKMLETPLMLAPPKEFITHVVYSWLACCRAWRGYEWVVYDVRLPDTTFELIPRLRLSNTVGNPRPAFDARDELILFSPLSHLGAHLRT